MNGDPAAALTMQAAVMIDAPAAVVWATLTDLASYPAWNRYCFEAVGVLAVGADVRIATRLGTSVQRVSNRVLEIVPERRLCWVSRNWYGFLVRGTRCRILEPQPDGRTGFREVEVMHGPLARLIVGLLRPQLTAGIQLECDSLKAEAERRAAG